MYHRYMKEVLYFYGMYICRYTRMRRDVIFCPYQLVEILFPKEVVTSLGNSISDITLHKTKIHRETLSNLKINTNKNT